MDILYVLEKIHKHFLMFSNDSSDLKVLVKRENLVNMLWLPGPLEQHCPIEIQCEPHMAFTFPRIHIN